MVVRPIISDIEEKENNVLPLEILSNFPPTPCGSSYSNFFFRKILCPLMPKRQMQTPKKMFLPFSLKLPQDWIFLLKRKKVNKSPSGASPNYNQGRMNPGAHSWQAIFHLSSKKSHTIPRTTNIAPNRK